MMEIEILLQNKNRDQFVDLTRFYIASDNELIIGNGHSFTGFFSTAFSVRHLRAL